MQFFSSFPNHVNVTNVVPTKIAAAYFGERELDSPVVVSPKSGGIFRAKQFHNALKVFAPDVKLVTFVKEKFDDGSTTVNNSLFCYFFRAFFFLVCCVLLLVLGGGPVTSMKKGAIPPSVLGGPRRPLALAARRILFLVFSSLYVILIGTCELFLACRIVGEAPIISPSSTSMSSSLMCRSTTASRVSLLSRVSFNSGNSVFIPLISNNACSIFFF